MAGRFPLEKFLILSCATVIFYSIHCSEAFPREVAGRKLKETLLLQTTNGKVPGSTGTLTKSTNGERSKIQDRARTIECITNGIMGILGTITGSLSSIKGNLTNSANLSSLFTKPSGGGGLGSIDLTSLFSKPGGCSLIDPLIIANIPGIFFWTPLVILGVGILVGVIAAIIIAVGGLGGNITDSIHEMIKNKMNQGGYAESTSSSYGVPMTSYGSPSTSYSRLTESMDQLTDSFSQAYDKYSALQSQQDQSQQSPYQQKKDQQQQHQVFKDYYENQSQYDQWNQIARARKG